MRRFLFTLLYCFLLILSSITCTQAQWLNQTSITQKLQLYALANPSPTLFVHFDKTIYTNNETVWFTAYLVKCGINDIDKHQVLSVALVRDIDSAIIKQDKYLMNRGLSFGSMLLPDSMLTGNYHFQVSTNRVIKGTPDAVFIQPVVVKTNIDPAFNASIKLLSPGTAGKTPNQVLLNVITRDARFLPKPVDVSYKYGSTVKKTKTNASGELILSLPEQENITDPNVYAKLKYGKDSSFINLTLPVAKRKAAVKFYPEGGNLIDSIPCMVAWEVKDQQLSMVTLKAQLYKDNQVIDTIETNSYGIGKFMLKPEKNSTYKVKLMHSGFADSSYYLPAPIKNGLSLFIADAAAKDTLVIRIFSNQPQKVALRLHDFKETYLYKEYEMNSLNKVLKIPLAGIPKGLKSITVSDSIGRPLSERMFFARYDPQEKVIISTDKPVYGQREKVTLKLKLKDTDTIGFVSIACVQDNRLSARLTSDIEDYTYLHNELGALPLTLTGNGYNNKAYVEDMLRVKGWSKYTWQSIMQTNANDTLRKYDTLAFKIRVTRFDKPVKKPVDIGLMRETDIGINKTDPAGRMTFKNEDLLMEPGKKMTVVVLGKNQNHYSVKTDDPYPKLNKSYLKLIPLEYTTVPSTVQNNTELSLKSNEKITRLKEVKITSGNHNDLHYKRGANACGDYVCLYNILNCRNHISDPGNRHPIAGQTYKDGLGGGMIVYTDCKDEERDRFIVPIQGIYTKREFYIDDYADPLEPAFTSTLYWNHGAILQSGEEEFTFYTGDITGKFRIVVQGITANDVTSEQYFFEVKGK